MLIISVVHNPTKITAYPSQCVLTSSMRKVTDCRVDKEAGFVRARPLSCSHVIIHMFRAVNVPTDWTLRWLALSVAKLTYSHIYWSCFENKMLRRISGPKKRWKSMGNWENYIMESFIACSFRPTLLTWSNEGEWDGKGIKQIWMKQEMLVGKPEGIIWGVIDVDGSLVLIWALGKGCLSSCQDSCGGQELWFIICRCGSNPQF
jgi:hypothetical protein